MAPDNAIVGPGDVRVQVLRVGDGDSPGSVDSMLLDFSMWDSEGKLAFSSYPETRPVGFSVSSLPPNLRTVLTQLRVGSKVRLWVPHAALAGWKPPPWPDTDLVFELELLSVTHVTVKDMSGNEVEPLPYQPPDAAGPPKTASSTRSGLRYIYLARATAGRHPTLKDRLDLNANVYVVEGIEVRAVQAGLKTATTLERAPAKIGEVLSQLSSGDRVRIWLPKGEGRRVVPEAGSAETIVDVGVSF